MRKIDFNTQKHKVSISYKGYQYQPRTMDFVVYSGIFWVPAIIYTLLEAKSLDASIVTSIVKVIPALSAVIFIYLSMPSLSWFYLLLVLSLAFCGLGDIAIEYDILPGLGSFLVSHILFTVSFVVYSLTGLTLISVAGFIIVMSAMLTYVAIFHKYLTTAEEPTKLLPAVDLYAIAISLTLSSSVLLWLSANTTFGFFPVIGAAFFVFSDSLIGVREFHHRFRFDEPITMITYYLAIFLLSLAATVYAF